MSEPKIIGHLVHDGERYILTRADGTPSNKFGREQPRSEIGFLLAGDKLLRKIAVAIWTSHGAIPRLLDEPARLGSTLQEEQSRCWTEAHAVMKALAE